MPGEGEHPLPWALVRVNRKPNAELSIRLRRLKLLIPLYRSGEFLVLNPKIATPLALAILVALAGCAKKEPAADAAKAPEAPAAAAQPAQPHPMPSLEKSAVDLAGIAKAEGGKTIEEIFAEKATLAGGKVDVRGKVVKVNPGIMGKNWLHIRDGSGADGHSTSTIRRALRWSSQ